MEARSSPRSCSTKQPAASLFPAVVILVNIFVATPIALADPVIHAPAKMPVWSFTTEGGCQPAVVTIGAGTLTYPFTMGTLYHDYRSQSIYLASQIGTSGTITAVALNVAQIPPRTMNKFTIRMKHTALAAFSSCAWEGDWTNVYQANETVTTTGWHTFALRNPFAYDGTSNLMVDFSHDDATTSSTDGLCYSTQYGGLRSAYYWSNSQYGDPLTWMGTTPPPQCSSWAGQAPNIQLTIGCGTCDPPPAPKEPDPADGATDVPLNPTLSWNQGTPPPGWYSEDFNDGLAQDWQADNPAYWQIVSGEYRADTGAIGIPTQSLYTGQTWADCSCEVKMRRTGYNAIASALVLRASPDFSAPNSKGFAYWFAITGDQKYWIGKIINGVYSSMQAPTTSTYLNAGTAVNVVKASAQGSTVKVFFNGNLAWSGTDTSILDAGRIGVSCHSGGSPHAVHYFDDVVVNAPAADTGILSAEQQWYNEHPRAGGSAYEAPDGGRVAYPGPVAADCPVTYDVYLGTSPASMAKRCSDITATSCPVTGLSGGTKYYWQVVAKVPGAQTPGPVWSFTTTGSCRPTVVTIGTGTSRWPFCLGTRYHDFRSQSIYPASDIGTSGTICSLALNVYQAPSRTLNKFTIRMKHTPLPAYSTCAWETDWTTVYQADETITTTGWHTFQFTTPFAYDGVSNLMVDFCHDGGTTSSPDGLVLASGYAGYRSAYFWTNSQYGDPLTWIGATPKPSCAGAAPNIKLSIGCCGCPLPAAPNDPDPADGATGVSLNPTLSWNQGPPPRGWYSEDFNDGLAQGWQPSNPAHWQVVNGEYRADAGGTITAMLSVYTSHTWADCSMEAKLRRTGDMNAVQLIVLRATADFNITTGSAYVFTITGNRQFYVGKFVNGSFSLIQPLTGTPYLNAGTAVNVVKASAQGSTLKAYFNGTPAWSGSDTSIASAGRIGLLNHSGYSGAVFYHDDVVVDAPAADTGILSSEQQWYNEHPRVGGSAFEAPGGGRAAYPGPVAADCPVTYDVYLGTSPASMTKRCSDISTTSCPVTGLDRATHYYWKVVAKNSGGSTEGPVWSFATEGACPPVTITIGTGTSEWPFPICTYWQDARLQSIYRASEIGGPATVRSLAINVAVVPRPMENFTIRMKHTLLDIYPACGWEGDWTTVYQADETIAATGWHTFQFTTPFVYDGTRNLMVDFSFNNSTSGLVDGRCYYSGYSKYIGYRSSVAYANGTYGDPLTWIGMTPRPYCYPYAANIQLTLFGDSIAYQKRLPDGARACLSGKTVTAVFGDRFYIEEADRSCGVMVLSPRIMPAGPAAGDRVDVTGSISTDLDGERLVNADNVAGTGAGQTIEPLLMTNKDIGGCDWYYDPATGAGQRGVKYCNGANNIGLLVRTSGRVTAVGSTYYYIDDGTRAIDGSMFAGIRIECGEAAKPKKGETVAVTGISSIRKVSEHYFRRLLVGPAAGEARVYQP